MELELKKMEEAALRSYAKDISASADMTARSIHSVMVEATTETPTVSQLSQQKRKQVDPMRLEGDLSDDEGKSVGYNKTTDPSVNESLWIEGKSDEGHTYYWNVKTNESVWEKPKEGFMPLAEYNRINAIALAQQQIRNKSDASKNVENEEEKKARYFRERLKDFRSPDFSEESVVPASTREYFKTEEEAATPNIGSWQSVQEEKYVGFYVN